jgi:uncharacterized protein YggL (DUF469 family)
MNEEALNKAYSVFKSAGYADSIDDFKVLIATNSEALNKAYSVFKSAGYADSVDDFKTLLGVTPVKKKGSSGSVGQNQGTMASSASQQQVEGILSDLQFDKETYTPQPTGNKDILSKLQSQDKAYTPDGLSKTNTQAPSQFDPAKFVAPEQPLVTDSQPVNLAKTSATKGFNTYYNTLDKAVNSGLVQDEKEFKQKFPDMTNLSFEQGKTQLDFSDKYDSLSDEIKQKIEPGIIREDGVVTGINPDLISKKDMQFLQETAMDDDWFGQSSEEQAQLVIKNIVPQQKIDYLIKEKELYALQDSIIGSKEEIERLAKNGFAEEAQNLVDGYNSELERYKSLSKNLNDKSILINSLDIAKDNMGMWSPISTAASAVERLGSSVIMAIPSIAATGVNLISNLPGMPGEVSEMGSDVEKSLMQIGMDMNKTWKEVMPTDSDDTVGNFIGDVSGQIAFVVGSAVLGGAPASLAAGYTMSMSEMYEEATQNGLSHDDAMYLSKIYGGVSAPLEMLGAGGLIKKATGVSLRKQIIKSIIKEGAEGFTKEIADQAIKRSFKPLLKETLKEGLEEGLQEGTQYLLSKGLAEAYNEYLKEDGDAEYKKTKMLREEGDAGFAGITKAFWGELGENMALGSAGGMIGGVSLNVMQGNVYTGSNYKAIESMLLDTDQMAKINDQLTAYRKNGTIKTDEELQLIKERVGIVQEAAANVDRATKAMPESFGIEQQKRTFALVAEKISAEKQIEGMMPILAETKKAEIEQIDNKIRDIASGKITEADLIAERTTDKFKISPEIVGELTVEEKKIVNEGGVLEDKEYAFEVVPKELKEASPIAEKTKGEKTFTTFTGKQLIESGFLSNAQKAFESRQPKLLGQGMAIEEDTIVEDIKPTPIDVKSETIKIEETRQEELNSEKSFEGNRTQAELLRLPGNYLKKGDYVQIKNVNISQDTTMPDYRTGKFKIQMISVNVDGKDGIVTLSDGNEVITPKISDLINAKYDEEVKALTAKQETTLTPDQQTALDEEVKDLESALAGDVVPQFRMKSGEDYSVVQEEVEKIASEIDEIPSENADVELRDTEKVSDVDVDELNKRTDTKLKKTTLKVIEGIPTIFTITDQLRTGNVINKITNNVIDRLKGAFGFNGTEGHSDFAWANVTKKIGKDTIKKATTVYNSNKDVFDKWWAANPEYNGLVPMAVVKMGKDAMLSNEAVFRVLNDNIKTLPIENRTNALAVVKESVDLKLSNAKSDKVITVFTALKKAIEQSNATSIDGILSEDFIKSLSLPARAELTKIISYGSTNTPGKKAVTPGKPKAGSVAYTLLSKQSKESYPKIHLGSVTDIITDPQLKDIPIGNIVSIVGVDVLNPEVKNSTHPNYPFGVKGKSIGILEKPVAMANAFPTAYQKFIKTLIKQENETVKDKKTKEVKPKISSAKSIRSQQTGVGIGITSKDYIGVVAKDDINNLDKLALFMNIAFPSVVISTDAEAFSNILQSDGVKKYLKGGEIIYGVTVGGDVYVNPDVHNSQSALFNTAIHEMGHVWTDYLQTTEEGKKIYNKGVEIIKEEEEYKKQLKLFNGDTKAAANEAMAVLIGNKGETIVQSSISSKFQEWLLGMWKYVQGKFKMSSELTPKDVENLTVNQFLEAAIADIFSGVKMTNKMQEKMIKNPEAAFSKTDSMQSIISKGRSLGFSDASIKEVLKGRQFTAKDIDAAMEVFVDLETTLPKEFADIEGGTEKGYELFMSIRQQVRDFSKQGPKGGKGNKVIKTFSEMSQKAAELLRNDPLFQQQSEYVQLGLLTSFNRTLGVKTDKTITDRLNALKKNLKERKIGEKELRAIQNQLRDFINKNLTKSGQYNKSQINSLLSIVEKVNKDNYRAKAERIVKLAEKYESKINNANLKNEAAEIRNNIKQKKLGANELKALQIQIKNTIRESLPKSKTYTQAQVNRLISIVANTNENNFDTQINKVIKEVEAQRKKMRSSEIVAIQKLLTKGAQRDVKNTKSKAKATWLDARGSKFFTISKGILNDILSGKSINNQIDNVLLEDILQKWVSDEALTSTEENILNEAYAYDMFGNVENMGLEEVLELKEKLKLAGKLSANRFKLKRQIQAENRKEVYQEAREAISKNFKILYNPDGTRKSDNDLQAQRDLIWENFSSLKIWSGIKQWANLYDLKTMAGIGDYFRNNLAHLGTLTNILDKSGDFFTKNIYAALNIMHEDWNKGYYQQGEKLNDLAKSIPGIESYKDLISKFTKGTIDIKLNSSEKSVKIDSDEAMRLYALSKNEDQLRKMNNMGINENVINQIKAFIGVDAMTFADLTVEYLSDDYYDSVNQVFRNVHERNLAKEKNYFPTQSEVKSTAIPDITGDVDFSQVLSVESGLSALKGRVDMEGDILFKGIRFTDVLQNHLESMERFKAYAYGTQKITTILKSKDTVTLLRETGLANVIKFSIIDEINPSATIKDDPNFIDKLLSRYTSYALGFKLMQIPKQATSFITAFEEYRFRPPGEKRIPVIDTAVDLLMFTVDAAYVISTLPSQYKKFREVSSTFAKRMDEGLQGDIHGLESGAKGFKPLSKRNTRAGRIQKGFKKASAAPTVYGDALGVMGYMINYNRDIKNGMKKADALEKLNNYNATQQSRRNTEKNKLQRNTSTSSRVFTMFGSTLFLQMNKVSQAVTNMSRDIFIENKMPSAKDTRGLILNLGVANVFFAFVANIFKYLMGGDDDEKEVLKNMRDSMIGLNQLYKVPIIGASVKLAVDLANGDRNYNNSIVNPINTYIVEINKNYKKKEVIETTQSIIEAAMGVNLDPAMALYNIFNGEFDDENWYKLGGVSKSYRPGSAKGDKSKGTTDSFRERAGGREDRSSEREGR